MIKIHLFMLLQRVQFQINAVFFTISTKILSNTNAFICFHDLWRIMWHRMQFIQYKTITRMHVCFCVNLPEWRVFRCELQMRMWTTHSVLNIGSICYLWLNAATHYREGWFFKIVHFYQLVREGYREITSDFKGLWGKKAFWLNWSSFTNKAAHIPADWMKHSRIVFLIIQTQTGWCSQQLTLSNKQKVGHFHAVKTSLCFHIHCL